MMPTTKMKQSPIVKLRSLKMCGSMNGCFAVKVCTRNR